MNGGNIGTILLLLSFTYNPTINYSPMFQKQLFLLQNDNNIFGMYNVRYTSFGKYKIKACLFNLDIIMNMNCVVCIIQ